MKIIPLLHKLTNEEYSHLPIKEEGSEYYGALFKTPPEYSMRLNVGVIICSFIFGGIGSYMFFSALGQHTALRTIGYLLIALLCAIIFLFFAYSIYKTGVFKDRIESGVYTVSHIIIDSLLIDKLYNKNNNKQCFINSYFIYVCDVKLKVTKEFFTLLSTGDEVLLFIVDDYLAGSIITKKSETIVDNANSIPISQQLEDTITLEQINSITSKDSEQ